MSQDQQRKIAYDLAMEYMKQRQLLSDVDCNIPNMVDRFSDVYEKFFNSLTNSKINKLL